MIYAVNPDNLDVFCFESVETIPARLIVSTDPRPTHNHVPVFTDGVISWYLDPATERGNAESAIKTKRDELISAQDWRYARHVREVRLSLSPHDDISKLDTYIQALANITKQTGYPYGVTWPVAP